uniref:Cyclic nucleotide-binding domain-containing protein n=1 Tax=Oryza meridionalis TaxID=40149 RepID=A0A0E0EZM7_9ORYZ
MTIKRMAAKTPRSGQESAYMPPPSVGPPDNASTGRSRVLRARARVILTTHRSSPPLRSPPPRQGRGEGILTAGALTAATLQNPPGRREGISSDSVRARATAIVGPRSRGGAGMWRHAARRSSAQIRRSGVMSSSSSPSAPAAAAGAAVPGPCIVHKRGTDILHDPWFNKDTAFPMTERDRLGLRGLLPPRVMSFEQQYDRFINSFRSLEHNTRGEPDTIVALAKWRILNRLHDRNETLYYRVLIDNIKDFAPIIYTPTVGLVCENYSGLFRRPRGMYFSAKDKGEMMSMIYNWPAEKVDMIVVTDGSRILGLGDLGVQGIGIPIGKLDVYVAAAGLRQPRLEGEEYLSVVDEFMEAVHARWPKAVVQVRVFSESSAGIGVLNMAKQAMLRMPGINRSGEGHNQFWVLDKDVRKVKPHVLLGLSGVGGIFNEEVLKAMKESDSPRPAIFAMSNPTTKAECTPEDVFKYVGENAVFASGSPFSNVTLGNGRQGYANQANNMYLFPGIGLGALLSGARHITDGMLQSAAECLASYITDDEIRKGILFPSISRHITARVGAAVVRAAVDEDLAEGRCDVDARDLKSMTEADTVDYVARKMWYPIYSPLVNDK